MNIYEKNGYKSRTEYLHSLSDEYDVDYGTVVMLAQMLGKSEDFDGLVCALEDYDEYEDMMAFMEDCI